MFLLKQFIYLSFFNASTLDAFKVFIKNKRGTLRLFPRQIEQGNTGKKSNNK